MSLWQPFTCQHLTLTWQSWARNRPSTWASAKPDPLSPILTGQESNLYHTAWSRSVGLYQIFLIGIKPLGIKTGSHHVMFDRWPQQLDQGFICVFSFCDVTVNHLFQWRINQLIVLLHMKTLTELRQDGINIKRLMGCRASVSPVDGGKTCLECRTKVTEIEFIISAEICLSNRLEWVFTCWIWVKSALKSTD